MTPTIYTENEAFEVFDSLLDDCMEPFRMGYLEFLPSEILKKMDPVAYREDFLNYINSAAEDGMFYVEGYTDEDLEEETEETED
jgi:hypothetical protein